MKIKINAPIFAAPDGYGQAAREIALSLIENNVELTLNNVYNRNDYSSIDKDVVNKLLPFLDKKIDYEIVLDILIPNAAEQLIENGKKNIVYTMWETSDVHEDWIKAVNKFDKLIVPAQNSIEAFKKAEVSKCIVPIPADVDKFDDVKKDGKFLELAEYLDKSFVFYNIFQWSERKNPNALLRAYYSSFNSSDNVYLVIKSNYKNDQYDDINIKSFVSEIRNGVKRNNNDYPKVIIITESVEEATILKMHKFFDVLVYPTRGEGWGIPAFDAALAGTHIITTRGSSHYDFLDTYYYFKNQTYDFVDFRLENVHSINNSFYSADQFWHDASVEQIAKKMRECYDYWIKNKVVCGIEQRQEYVEQLKKRFNRKKIGKRLIDAFN